MAASQIGIAIPNFWFAILLILLFAVHLQWVSAGGFPGWLEDDGGGLWEGIKALILPAVALALVQAAILARVTRSAVLDVMREDFVRTARAKGLSRRQALWRHVLRNAMIPVLTVSGLQFANLITGTIVVENVFVLPGIGRLVFQAISNRDLLVVRDVVMLLAAVVVIVNFVVDVLYAVVDPRLEARVMSLARRALRHPSFVVGASLSLLLTAAALLSLVWAPYPPAEIDIPSKLQPPSAAHWLGTDSLGRDIASQLLVGAQNSIVVGVVAVGIGLLVGVALGCLASASGAAGWKSS
jgi:ABC-type dipeptide/oligopeptide/nickel transport system permease component